MSADDRDRWNQRYQEGFYSERHHPTKLLAEWVDKLPRGRALDLACGRGRNTRFLASEGYDVVGVDISEVAIEQAKRSNEFASQIEYVVADLDQGLPDLDPFNLVVLVRFVDIPLIRKIPQLLCNNGVILIEEHLLWHDSSLELAGPKTSDFRIPQGTLKELLGDLQILYEFEGLLQEPDGGTAAIGQIIVSNSS